eukprot:scaffold72985_cov52-Attheya_sp.AAC.4
MNVAIDACARARPTRLKQAFALFHHGLGISPVPTAAAAAAAASLPVPKKSQPTLSPNVFTFGALMSACARGRDPDRAMTLLRSMKEEHGIEPNAVVYSTAISACERSDPPKAELALELLREATTALLLATTNTNANTKTGPPMSVVGYNAAISALARAGQWKVAVQLLEEMTTGPKHLLPILTTNHTDHNNNNNDDTQQKVNHHCHAKPDAVTYGTVMAACERSEEWYQVLRFADAMQTHANDDPPIVMDGMAITSALHACQRLGMADEAIFYLNLMKGLASNDDNNDATSNNNNNTNTNASSRNGWEKKRTQSLTQGRERKGGRQPLKGPDAVAYRLAISACARTPRGERWIDAIRLLDEMRKETGAADVVAYTAAITGCAGAGEWIKAFQLLDLMRKENIEPNVVTYSAVIDACATASAMAARSRDDTTNNNNNNGDEKVDNTDSHNATQKPMKKAIQLLKALNKDQSTVDPNIVTYNAAIRACAEGLDLDAAFCIMKELQSCKGRIEPNIVTYGSLMTACERVGNVDGASRVFQMMRDHNEQLQNSKEEEHEKGTVTKRTMKPNEIIYGAAISCCRKGGEPERALLLLRKMIQDGRQPNAATFNTVMMAQTEEGTAKSVQRAVLVYRMMKSPKYNTPTGQPNRQTYTILIRALAANRMPEIAESFLRLMQQDSSFQPDVDLYTTTVTSYERCGHPLKALRLMESMTRDGYDFYEVKVLNAAFKKAVKLANAVGSGLIGNGNSTSTDAMPSASTEGKRFSSDGDKDMKDFFVSDSDREFIKK